MIDEGLICADYRDAKDKKSQISNISQLHGVSKDVVIEVLERHGYDIPRKEKRATATGAPSKKQVLLDGLRELAGRGITVPQAAAELGYNVSYIYRCAKSNGIKFSKGHVFGRTPIGGEPLRLTKFKELAAKGYTVKQAAAEMGMTPKNAYAYCYRHGVKLAHHKTTEKPPREYQSQRRQTK